MGSPSRWDADSAFASLLDEDGIQMYHLQDGMQTYHVQYVQVDPEADEDDEGQQAPPYPHRHRSSTGSGVMHQRHPFPHSLSSPQILTPPASPAHVRVTILPPVRHARHHLETVDAHIFLSGSAGSLSTTVAFLYVLWSFPRFIRHVKSEGASPTVVVHLCTFYQSNLARVVSRFSSPLILPLYCSHSTS
ncbi:uncharacterized protein LAESUDRAFT_758067 [Laetiporus sulphureus 93-53]|uniref:Uncharacterized protein n=1 Tax=Laetiporus sulphureus 93-53 TaxID=1314785 RepID=A0A165EXQ3_9APHY|nr:uncharacterized protein LAESUDRAFT_758067 [Laetiporus sulphureus 93-53]KZT07936.1 hypothetical protein LAESUDRAFT_758067 [Laetiporus sulphureus 93-53]